MWYMQAHTDVHGSCWGQAKPVKGIWQGDQDTVVWSREEAEAGTDLLVSCYVIKYWPKATRRDLTYNFQVIGHQEKTKNHCPRGRLPGNRKQLVSQSSWNLQDSCSSPDPHQGCKQYCWEGRLSSLSAACTSHRTLGWQLLWVSTQDGVGCSVMQLFESSMVS